MRKNVCSVNMILPDFADHVRLERAARDMGCEPSEVAARIVHAFFARKGVKNPSRRARVRRAGSAAVGV